MPWPDVWALTNSVYELVNTSLKHWREKDLRLDLWHCRRPERKVTTCSAGSCSHFGNSCKNMRCFIEGNSLRYMVKWCYCFRELSVWRFDLFSEEKAVLLASTPPIVCARPCVSANPSRLDTVTMLGLYCCTFTGSHSHHLALCFSTLPLDSRS